MRLEKSSTILVIATTKSKDGYNGHSILLGYIIWNKEIKTGQKRLRNI